ncbi:MAG: hypothetical protein IPI35_16080 [Deltaproteobacteria bacterium]|nr:hypothetical protein [Deltaproteobacteria bacterium]
MLFPLAPGPALEAAWHHALIALFIALTLGAAGLGLDRKQQPLAARVLGTFATLAGFAALLIVVDLARGGAKPLHRDETELNKIWLASGAALLAAVTYLWHRHLEPKANQLASRARGAITLGLGLLATLSFLNYSRLDSTYVWVERVDTYDLSHYYLNSKYYKELGYFDLYPAIVLADLEEGRLYRRQPPTFQTQNEEDYYMVDTQAFARDTEWHDRIRAKFGPERWAAFKHDFIYLQRDMVGFTNDLWIQMLWDHGFNGSPAWVVFAEPLANAVPVESVKLLGYIDLIWLSLAVAVTWWAFGGPTALFLVIFLFTTYSARWPTYTWAFGRDDYVAVLIMSVGLLKRGLPGWAGAAVGVGAAFRLFPAVWLYGPAMKGLWELVSLRQINRGLLKIAIGFVACLALLYGAVAVKYGPGRAIWHVEKLLTHTTEKNLSSMRQGFAIAVAYQGETDVKRMDDVRRMRVKNQKTWRNPLAFALVLLLGWGLRRAKDHEALSMGFIPFFLLTTASYYYYIVRSTMIVTHAGDLSRLRNAVGLIFLFGIEVALNALQQNDETSEFRVIHMGWLGRLCAMYSLLMIAWFLWEARTAPADDTNPSSAAGSGPNQGTERPAALTGSTP